MHSLHRYTPPQWSTPFIILLLMHASITLLPSHPLIYQHRSAKTCKSKQDIRGKATEKLILHDSTLSWSWTMHILSICLDHASCWRDKWYEPPCVQQCDSRATLHNHHLSTTRGCLGHVPFSSCSWLENWWLGSGARPFSCNLIICIQLQHCITWGFHAW
jgi:hypothetical protein